MMGIWQYWCRTYERTGLPERPSPVSALADDVPPSISLLLYRCWRRLSTRYPGRIDLLSALTWDGRGNKTSHTTECSRTLKKAARSGTYDDGRENEVLVAVIYGYQHWMASCRIQKASSSLRDRLHLE